MFGSPPRHPQECITTVKRILSCLVFLLELLLLRQSTSISRTYTSTLVEIPRIVSVLGRSLTFSLAFVVFRMLYNDRS